MLAAKPTSMIRNRDMNAAWRHIDISLCVLVAVTAVFGTAMIYSATVHKDPELQDLSKHIVFLVLGVGVMALTAIVDYRRIRDWSRLIYLGAMALLVLVLTPAGSEIRSIKAWFVVGPLQLQPSELAKLAVIIAVASYLGSVTTKLGLNQLIVTLVGVALPTGLILLQPDLGTALVFIAIAAGMLLVSGMPARFLVAVTILGVVGMGAILSSNQLDQYQTDRLVSFIDPDNSDAAAVYNTNQAQIGISSGGVLGQGYLDGTQTKGGFVPEQQTDFIFTVPGEELGFVGAGLLLALLGGIAWRIWRIAQMAQDAVGTLICVGVLSMFLFHVFENVGMNLGIMPVTGIPLPFISYGGSATLTAFAAMGLVLNVHMRRFS